MKKRQWILPPLGKTFRGTHPVEVNVQGYEPRYFSDVRCAVRTAHDLLNYDEHGQQRANKRAATVKSEFETLRTPQIEEYWMELMFSTPVETVERERNDGSRFRN